MNWDQIWMKEGKILISRPITEILRQLPLLSLFHNWWPVSVKIIQTQKEEKLSKRQLEALDR